ncbi:translation elongation factor Ts [Kangiella spongicola]|uniref:Elongation factor Ts n=1 Tax=Kangiella spongicola TaxID=796379 RepID=A0A318DAL8_9GAMM|nr:translation elongation factor Ts [Kangiella spongicola]PXF63209.1 elongation factor Ts [Kangiella spongicola]
MAITAALVKELRERTGAGMMECKKALIEADGNVETAIDNMRKSGQAKAAKKAGRIAAEGVILAKSGDNTGVLVEVNSETDFVARDDSFKKFSSEVVDVALVNGTTDVEALNAASMPSGESVEEARANLVAKIGENITVRRVAKIDGETLGAYVHGGRIGVIVSLDGGSEDLAKDIAMHVAASNPQFNTADDVAPEVIEKEKEIIKAQPDMEGKPENIVEKMMVGRIKKFVGEITLEGQSFVKDPSTTVGQLLKENNAKVISYTRFEVGEGIEKKEEDFASEVAAQMKK